MEQGSDNTHRGCVQVRTQISILGSVVSLPQSFVGILGGLDLSLGLETVESMADKRPDGLNACSYRSGCFNLKIKKSKYPEV